MRGDPGPDLSPAVGTVTETKKWIDEFEKRAGPLLREIFEKDLGTTPPKLIERIEMLRKAEKKLLSGKLK